MSDVDGTWNCTVSTPLGDQEFTLRVQSAGDSFTGRAEGAMGALDIEGEVDGDRLDWSMRVPKPMPTTLACTAMVAGDRLTGKAKAGIFGSFDVAGVRA